MSFRRHEANLPTSTVLISLKLPIVFALAVHSLCFAASDNRYTNWPVYLGDEESSQSSPLEQINRNNVHKLDIAWTFKSNDIAAGDRTQIQCNPLIIDGILYGTTPQLTLFALNAEDGTEIWRFDPFDGKGNPSRMGVNRGLAFWEKGDQQRLLFGTQSSLYAIDPQTGAPISEFGVKGKVDLKEKIGRDSEHLAVVANTPGVVFEDLIILGMRVAEGPGPAAPGPIRAYNIITGELVWKFNTIPLPGEFGYETWPEDAYKTIGGANVWSGISLDDERGIVYCPTGSASFDFWGGNRLGDNLFANSLIALDARTGERVWHYQVVRHDLWDRDLPTSPNLLEIERNGKKTPAVAQITKSGHVFIFNRETGESLFPIKEYPVPESDLKGEKVAASQPLPTLPEPFARQVFSAEIVTNRTPEANREILNQYVNLKPHVPWVPPSREGTIIFPGFDGGGEWGGAAVDSNGILYVNSSELPWIMTMVDIEESQSVGHQLYLKNCASCHGQDLKGSQAYGMQIPALDSTAESLTELEMETVIKNGKGIMPPFAFLSKRDRAEIISFLKSGSSQDSRKLEVSETDIPYAHTGYRKWYDSEGYPAVKPPWGTLNAIDLNTGEYVWRRTLGNLAEANYPGVDETGAENYGGPIITASGLLFIAATRDEKFRAFDTTNGELLWEAELPAGGYATPSTYSIDGKQYVVIACGGGKMGTPAGDYYVAFALPD